MPGRVALLLLASLAFISFRFQNHGPVSGEIDKLYQRADSLFHLANPTATTDSEALASFEQLIKKLERGFPDQNPILFQSYFKKGILLDLNANYNEAKEAYLKALAVPGIKDSIVFTVEVYVGTSYYNLNNFDSANYFLLKAESLIARFPAAEDKARLYNTLGALYYDNGNYLQSKNYFNQALQVIKSWQPKDINAIVSIETNIATSYYRLGLYDESLAIYSDILKYHVYGNYIYMNMGRANTALNRYQEALACFKKVNAAEVPGVLNEMAYTQLQLLRPDAAIHLLDQLQGYKRNNKLNNLDWGINASYRADLLISQQQLVPALKSLQKAIIIFSGNFTNPDIYANPSDFIGAFAYYRLFDALSAKAQAFELLYKQDNRTEYLLAALAAYQSTLSLLNYIEKSYDTDDAKILLKKRSRKIYQQAISVCLELNRLNPGANYLEQAFLISERNKASVMIASLQERTFKSIPGIEEKLLERERNIKYNIARLDIRRDQAQDSQLVETLANEKAQYEIQLAHLQKDFEQNNHYYKLKYDDNNPGIKSLQQHLGDDQALISFYTTAAALHVFIITRSDFKYVRIDSLSALEQEIENWLNLLKLSEGGRKFNGKKIGDSLYRQLVKPIQSVVPEKHEWIIIPDGILYFLPFESLPADSMSKSLLETTTISYQFSSRFIMNQSSSVPENDEAVLSFAPFVKKGIGFDQPGFASMNQLPASGDEIAGLAGKQYIDSAATKEHFLQELNKYPIVHLATHAVSDVNNSAASFIAFYPKDKNIAEDCLFLEELYGLNMDATRLVIISACETGQGQLVNNEGVISLARAFIYAGCSSTINSLWKADDKATSMILKQFYFYLKKGNSKARALQLAKLDYIKGNALYRGPGYWSHLILIGNTDPLYAKKRPYGWIIVILVSGGLLMVFMTAGRKRKLKKADDFH